MPKSPTNFSAMLYPLSWKFRPCCSLSALPFLVDSAEIFTLCRRTLHIDHLPDRQTDRWAVCLNSEWLFIRPRAKAHQSQLVTVKLQLHSTYQTLKHMCTCGKNSLFITLHPVAQFHPANLRLFYILKQNYSYVMMRFMLKNTPAVIMINSCTGVFFSIQRIFSTLSPSGLWCTLG